MRLHYDADSDALLIELVDATPAGSIDYEEGVTVALDAAGRVIALEILDFRERLDHGGELVEDAITSDSSSHAAGT